MVDERTRFMRLLVQARRMGRDVYEYLDNHHLILTNKRATKIRSQAMHDMADQIEQASIKKIITWYGSEGYTALDAQRGVVAMLRAIARQEESKKTQKEK